MLLRFVEMVYERYLASGMDLNSILSLTEQYYLCANEMDYKGMPNVALTWSQVWICIID